MTEYFVKSEDGTYSETFYRVSDAKKAMKAHWPATGTITRIWANGDWEPMGQIKLSGSNKTFCANTKQKKANY